MKVFWKQTPSPGNFGDVLTPVIFDYFGIKYEYNKDDYDAIAIGSIASKARAGTHVFGSGTINLKHDLCPDAVWHFVRGPITRECVLSAGGDCPEIYGDPAMLLPLVCPALSKTTDIGIVPHYVDYDYVKQTHPEYRVINVLNSDPLSVAQEISQCRFIIASSLHGLICAHAYGIPAAWMKFSDKIKGHDVKFHDHYAATKAELRLSTWNNLHFTAPKFDIEPIVNIFQTISAQ